MPNYDTSVAAIFDALGDPTRLGVIKKLSRGPASVSELAAPCGMSLPSFMQHLRLLEEVGLVTTAKVGRVRTCQLKPQALGTAEHWIALQRSAWEHKLDQLAALLDEPPPSSRKRS